MSHMKILFDIESKVGNSKGDLISRTEDVFIIVTKNLDDNSVITHYNIEEGLRYLDCCLLYTSPSPRDATLSRMPSSA